MVDINLTGAWHTAKASIPRIVGGGRGGGVVLFTSSVYGVEGTENFVLPGGVKTEMVRNFDFAHDFRYVPPPDNQPPIDEIELPPLFDPVEISNALVFLASDEARYLTGAALPVTGKR